MSAYTKGPWIAGELGSTKEDYVKSDRGNDIASVYPGDSDWDSGVAIANTNLIAAAPELLEALKEANDGTKLYEGHPGRWAELIAKAEGL